MTNSTIAESTPFNFTPYEESKGEEYMNDPQKEHFRKILLNWKSELMQEVDRTVSHMRDDAANFPDPTDRATQESEFSLELRTRDRERKLIKKIDDSVTVFHIDARPGIIFGQKHPHQLQFSVLTSNVLQYAQKGGQAIQCELIGSGNGDNRIIGYHQSVVHHAPNVGGGIDQNEFIFLQPLVPDKIKHPAQSQFIDTADYLLS